MMVVAVQALSRWAVPLLLLGITTLGLSRRVAIYESFVEGAKEGWQTAVRILPYLVGMGCHPSVQHSGALNQLISVISPHQWLGLQKFCPWRCSPYLDSGSWPSVTDLATFGPDSFVGRLAATIMGSSETSLYVLTVYAGSVGIRRTRHTLAASLISDFTGSLAALYIVLKYFA